MSVKKKSGFFPRFSNKLLILSAIALCIYGSLMIISASMGSNVGDTSILSKSISRQAGFLFLGFLSMIALSRYRLLRMRRGALFLLYLGVLFSLVITRFFGSVNGSYAWIRLFGFSLQPSEIAKVFTIVLAANLLGDSHNRIENLKRYAEGVIVYVVIIFLWQKDFGSAFVLFVMAYCMALIPQYPEYRKAQRIMIIMIFAVIIIAVFLLTPLGTKILESVSGNYMVGRFLASANPFLNPYDNGYHLIMSMISFATGGWFGLGYGNSIHKYMNFPNPSTDFILPVIVEEMGIIGGLLPILLMYTLILYPIVKYSKMTVYIRSRIALVGVFLYFVIHFILNVGGVSGLIPLTGVPLLILSSGGSSTWAALMSLGIAEAEIIYIKRNESGK